MSSVSTFGYTSRMASPNPVVTSDNERCRRVGTWTRTRTAPTRAGPALACFASEVTVAGVHPVQSHHVKTTPVQVRALGVGERAADGEADDVLRERAPLEVREDVAVVPVRVAERDVPEVGEIVAYRERVEDKADGVGRVVGRGMCSVSSSGQGIGRLLGHAPVDVKRDGATHFVGESGSLCGEQVVGILPQRAPDEESEEGVRVTRARDVDVLTGDAGDEREPSPIDQCDVLQQSPSFLQWLWSFAELEEGEREMSSGGRDGKHDSALVPEALEVSRSVDADKYLHDGCAKAWQPEAYGRQFYVQARETPF